MHKSYEIFNNIETMYHLLASAARNNLSPDEKNNRKFINIVFCGRQRVYLNVPLAYVSTNLDRRMWSVKMLFPMSVLLTFLVRAAC